MKIYRSVYDIPELKGLPRSNQEQILQQYKPALQQNRALRQSLIIIIIANVIFTFLINKVIFLDQYMWIKALAIGLFLYTNFLIHMQIRVKHLRLYINSSNSNVFHSRHPSDDQ
jgi:hypothetical protein